MTTDPSAAVTPDWDTWRAQVFGRPEDVLESGPVFDRLARLHHHDPQQAAGMLGDGLAAGDALAAEAVRHLHLSSEMVADWLTHLEAIQPTAQGPLAIEVATTLFALSRSPQWSRPILEVLASAETPLPVRIDAARRLAGFPPDPTLVEAVAQAIQLPDYLVRYHCANTLLHWSGDPLRDLFEHPDLFALVAAEERPDLWESAAATLSALVLPQAQ